MIKSLVFKFVNFWNILLFPFTNGKSPVDQLQKDAMKY